MMPVADGGISNESHISQAGPEMLEQVEPLAARDVIVGGKARNIAEPAVTGQTAEIESVAASLGVELTLIGRWSGWD